MADFRMYRGGPCNPGCLPQGAGTQLPTKPPYPKRVAAEYHRGFFTQGGLFNPVSQPYQGNFISSQTIAVGDFFSLVLVPEHHTLFDIAYRVSTQMSRHPTNLYSPVANMAGLAFDIVAKRYDATGALLGTVTLPAALAGVNGAVVGSGRAAVSPTTNGAYVPVGEWVEIGFKLNALPTTPGVTLKDISGAIYLAAHTLAYDTPEVL